MKFIQKRRQSSTIINLTPLIDCMFLLVIFILIAARFEPEGGIPVDLPIAKAPEAPKLEALHLTVTAEGKYYLEGKELTLEQLPEALIAARATASENVTLIILGDKDAYHHTVVDALSAAAKAKQKRVVIRTTE